jgi:hypothetical protein
MNDQPDRKDEFGSFDEISEADRKAALDIFGRAIIESRDRAVTQWDQILTSNRGYPAWERLLNRRPDLDERTREILKEALPHAIDTFMYCLLDELDGSRTIRVSVTLDSGMVIDVARASWGLAAEPTTDEGWLVRFSKQRFDQPG